MKVVYNHILPPSGFIAINLFWFCFVKRDYWDKLPQYRKNKVLNHESIHTAQMKDFCSVLFIGAIIFYIVYFFEWLYRVLFKFPFSIDAYYSMSFEREALLYENDSTYLTTRKHFAQWAKY